jgi:phosphatidylserine decarboxylase
LEKEGVLVVEVSIFLSCLIVAFLILIPLAVKWEINLKYALAGSLLFGSFTGTILSWDFLRRGLRFPWLILVETALILFLTVLTIALFFYRDPERISPKREGVIVSPADGKVLYVKEVRNGEVPFSKKKGRKFKLEELTKVDFLKNTKAYQVGIGMNFLNVHVNRAPISGHVVFLRHIPGKFLSLKREEAVLMNERVTTLIENSKFKVAVVQIASRLVRRIVPYVKEGQKVSIGERIGIIKFGSQVDLLIPELPGLKICVKPGDEVIAGVSIIAEYEERKGSGYG